MRWDRPTRPLTSDLALAASKLFAIINVVPTFWPKSRPNSLPSKSLTCFSPFSPTLPAYTLTHISGYLSIYLFSVRLHLEIEDLEEIESYQAIKLELELEKDSRCRSNYPHRCLLPSDTGLTFHRTDVNEASAPWLLALMSFTALIFDIDFRLPSSRLNRLPSFQNFLSSRRWSSLSTPGPLDRTNKANVAWPNRDDHPHGTLNAWMNFTGLSSFSLDRLSFLSLSIRVTVDCKSPTKLAITKPMTSRCFLFYWSRSTNQRKTKV